MSLENIFVALHDMYAFVLAARMCVSAYQLCLSYFISSTLLSPLGKLFQSRRELVVHPG